MAITFLGAKRIQGTKLDRKVDSLGSSADGTNTGITLLTPHGDFNQDALSFTSDGMLGGDFTIAGWIYPTSSSGYPTLFYNGEGGGNGRIQLTVMSSSSPKIELWSQNKVTESTSDWTLNKWQHVAITASGSTWKIYIDGTENGSGTAAASTRSDDETKLFGAENTSAANDFVGKMKTWCIYNRALSATDIGSLADESKLPTDSSLNTGSSLKLYLPMTSNFNDSSGNSVTINTHGNPSIVSPKLGTGAYEFDNTAEGRVELGSASDWQFLHNTGAKWTIATWFKRPTAFTNMSGCSLSGDLTWLCETTDGNDSGIGIKYDNRNDPDHRLQCEIVNESNSAVCVVQEDNWFPDDDDWHHLAITFDQTLANTNMIAYLDGVQKGTGNKSATPSDVDSGDTLRIGGGVDSHARVGNWTLDDFGIWKRVLTATEIGKLANNNVSGASGWDQGGTDHEISGGKLNINAESRGNHRIWYDLGSAKGDSDFVMRYEMNLTSYNSNNGGASMTFVSLSSNDGILTSTNDALNTFNYSGNGWRQSIADGTRNDATGNQTDSLGSVTAGTTYYMQMKRSGTTYTLSQHNSDYSSTTWTNDKTIGSGVTGLRYIKIQNGYQGNKAGWIDNIKFWESATASGDPDVDLSFTAGDGQLVSSLTDKSELKANYTMDSTSLEALKSSADLTDDFSSDTWTGCKNSACDNGAPTTIDISSGALRASTVNTASDDRLHKALGFTLSNSKWTCQFEVTLSSSNQVNIIALTDGSGNLNAADGLLVDYASSKLKMISYNGSSKGLESTGISTSTGTQYFVTLTRTSETGLKLDVRTGSHTGTLVGSETGTISSSTIDLDTVQSGAYGRQSGDATYVLDNLKIYNNSGDLDGCKNDYSSTSELEGMTNLPVNTIFEQTDDTPTYWWKQSDNTWSLDGSVIANTDMTTSYTGYTGDTGAYSYDSTENGITVSTSSKNKIIVKTLSSTLGKSDKWVARWKMTRKSGDNGDGYGIAFTSSGASSVSQINAGGYAYGIQVYMANSGTLYSASKNSGGSDDSASDSMNTTQGTGVTRYFQIRHISQTSYECKVFSDSTFETQVGDTETRTSSSQTLDYDQLAFFTKWGDATHSALYEDLEVQKGTTEWIV